MRLSFSPFHFSVIVAAAAAGFEKAFSLDVKNGEIPSSSRRSLNKSSKKTGPVPRTSEPSPSPSTPAPPTPAPTPPPTVNPIFTVDCTNGGISDHTASLYDEPYPTFSSDGDIFQSVIVENGIIGTGLLPTKGEDQLVYYSKGTAPGACMDDIVNHCAETCDSASNCTAFTTIIYKDGYRQNPFEEIGGVVFFCNLYNSNVPNLPLQVRSRIDGAFELVRVFALKTAQVDQPLAVYDPSDAWEKRDVALINFESKWISPALFCIATKSYTANPDETIVGGCTNCLIKTINTIYQPDANCEETGRFTCDKSDLNGVGFNTCASECFFDVGGPNDEICQNTVRVAFLALSGSNAVPCVMRDVYDADKGSILAPYTCPFMNLTLGAEYPYFPRELGPPTFAPTITLYPTSTAYPTFAPTITLYPTITAYPTFAPTITLNPTITAYPSDTTESRSSF